MAGTLFTMGYRNQFIGRKLEFGSALAKALLSATGQAGTTGKHKLPVSK